MVIFPLIAMLASFKAVSAEANFASVVTISALTGSSTFILSNQKDSQRTAGRWCHFGEKSAVDCEIILIHFYIICKPLTPRAALPPKLKSRCRSHPFDSRSTSWVDGRLRVCCVLCAMLFGIHTY